MCILNYLYFVKGIYIHIPFCRKKCIYCDFVVIDTNNRFSKDVFDEYTELVCLELDMRFNAPSNLNEFEPNEFNLNEFNLNEFKTIYFGGGTPSFIGSDNILKILNKIFSYIPSSNFEEVTVELNPEDVSLEFARELVDFGVNRVSLGIQSMSDNALKILSRRNTSQINHEALNNLSRVNFKNVNVDVIFDIPGVSLNEVIETLDTLLNYDIVKHVSVYGLTVEEFTPLKVFVDRGIINFSSSFEEEFYTIHDYLVSKGFNHYEISNYAIPGYESRHNLLYWSREEYIGVGISAWGFVKRGKREERYQNVISLREYKNKLLSGDVPIRYCEELTHEQIFEEILMLGLRKSEGINLDLVSNFVSGKDFLSKIQRFISDGLLERQGNILKPTLKGWLLNNSTILELIS